MTDIQRHLKGIRKILASSLEQADNTLDFDTLRQRVREFLPQGYGVTFGMLVGANDALSMFVPVIVYDVPLAGASPEVIQIEHALLVIDGAVQFDEQTLKAALKCIQSVKALKPPLNPTKRRTIEKPVGQSRAKIPKDRLPYSLIYGRQFADGSDADEALFSQLNQLLTVHHQAQRPDEILIEANGVHYLNPLLEPESANNLSTGLSRLPDFRQPENCYVCKKKYFRQHFFYKQLCLNCGDWNYHKRTFQSDLYGYVALVTGARLKIGYETTLRLLRAGAEVIATTRFPRDAARRYAQEPDFESWHRRLHVVGIDLRHIGRLEAFIDYLYEHYPYLDILVNNAAQTIKRPPAYYAHLIPFETAALHELPSGLIPLLIDPQPSSSLETVLHPEHLLGIGAEDPYFPHGQYDRHGQQVDNRPFNSWVMSLDEVSVSELLEVHLVNAVAPAVLAGQLKELMRRSPHKLRHIINVSAAEGRFAAYKQGYHPHTNMAKAALNMLTRSIAVDYAKTDIYVNSIDPGWVSDQVPRTDDDSRALADERLPIDMTDAAARICDPIFSGLAGEKVHIGAMLKDFQEVAW
jgi:NAD(P)-dependent dehydrogenase (short-subunit alcohol dehydrogenase family)